MINFLAPKHYERSVLPFLCVQMDFNGVLPNFTLYEKWMSFLVIIHILFWVRTNFSLKNKIN